MDAVEAGAAGPPGRAGYARSAGSPRGEARRRELLDRVTADLAVNGLPDFSLRRAARAAGTTHKVLLYYFDSADDLLGQAVDQLRGRRTAAWTRPSACPCMTPGATAASAGTPRSSTCPCSCPSARRPGPRDGGARSPS
jgi:AcrR family transcriptional regulator